MTKQPECRSWMGTLTFLFAAFFAMAVPATGLADPVWAGGPGSTLQRFDFTTSDLVTSPDSATNPLGTASATVTVDSPSGSGWQDPNSQFTTPGINGGDGAWDVGPAGLIEVAVPSSPVPPPGLSYSVEIFIEVIDYEGLVGRPVLTVDGHTIQNFSETVNQVEPDLFFGGYNRLEWTGVISAVSSTDLTFRLAAGAAGALVDAIEIHTRYVLNKAPATVGLSNLERLFDGTPKPVTVVTDPVNLTVNVTYDGSPVPPTNTGSYDVIATVDDAVYAGTATGTLQIANDSQTISFAAIADQIATATVSLSATGGASGNPVTFEVTSGAAEITGGTMLSFTGAGMVSVTASQEGNTNYLPAPPVTRTFAVSKAPATVTLSGLSQTYDGSVKSAGATTAPVGLAVSIAYDSSPTPPANAGSYVVVATIGDPIYEGSASGSLIISKASQTITFAPIADQVATGTLTLSAGGGSSGNPVTFAVTGGPAQITGGNMLVFTGSGTVSVTASQEGNANYFPAMDVIRTFTVNKASAMVTLSALNQTYDGSSKEAVAMTDPLGLGVVLTYGGSPVLPVDAGSYPVVATIDDVVYAGSSTGTLVVAKAPQEITFAAIPPQDAGDTVNLSASGGASGNSVTFAVTSGPGVITGGNLLSFSNAGDVTVTASQAGNGNYLAAPDVSRVVAVGFSGYDAWRAVEFPGETDPTIIGISARPYGQALPNGFRYYLGNEPGDPQVVTGLGEDGGEWVFSYTRFEPARLDVEALFEWSTDLETWSGDGETFGGVTVNFSAVAGIPGVDGRVPVELRAVPSGDVVDRLFVRLKLNLPIPIP